MTEAEILAQLQLFKLILTGCGIGIVGMGGYIKYMHGNHSKKEAEMREDYFSMKRADDAVRLEIAEKHSAKLESIIEGVTEGQIKIVHALENSNKINERILNHWQNENNRSGRGR